MHSMYIYICMIYIDLSVVSPEIPIRALQILPKLVFVTWHDGIISTKSVHLNPPKTHRSCEVRMIFESALELMSCTQVLRVFMQPFFGVGGLIEAVGWGLVAEELLVAGLLGVFFLQWGVCWIDWFIFWGFDQQNQGLQKFPRVFFRRVFSNYRWIEGRVAWWLSRFQNCRLKNEISSCIPSGLFTKYDSAGFPCGFHVFSTEVLLLKGFIGQEEPMHGLKCFLRGRNGKNHIFVFQWFPLLLLPFK